jgi:hypothetical protein
MAIRAQSQYPLVAEKVLVGGVDVAAQGTYDLFDLPGGAMIVGGWYEVVETFTGTGTIAIQIDDGSTQTTINAADAGGATGTGALDSNVPTATLSVPHTVQAVVATADLTDGKARVYVQYVLTGRAPEAG